MTIGRGEDIGIVSMEVVADASHFPDSVEHEVEKTTKHTDDELKKAGDQWGKTLTENMTNRLKKDAPKVGKDFERALSAEHVTAKVKVNTDTEVDHDSIKRGIRSVITEVEQELATSTGSGGIFNIFGKSVGQAIQDGVGAVFNVSGKSPLIIALIPLFGALIGAVGALLQAITAVVALLTTLPAIITGLGASALVLFAVFHGLGTAISAAFAAKNPKELNAALKDLVPGAQSFIRALLPIRDIFKDISQVAQQEFLSRATPAVKAFVAALKFAEPYLGELAIGLGEVAKQFGTIFKDPKTLAFLSIVLNDTYLWIQGFGDALVTLINGFRDLAIAAEPFLNNFGLQFNQAIKAFGDFLTQLANDPDAQKFFDDMKYTIASIIGLLRSASNFVMVFLAQLDNAGGTRLIDALSNVFNQWSFILEGKPGTEVLKGIVNFGVAAIYIVGGLISVLLIFIADVQIAGEYIQWLFQHVDDFVGWLVDKWNSFWDIFGSGLSGISERTSQAFDGIRTSIVGRIDDAVAAIKALPGRAVAAIGNLGQALYRAGASLIQGFIDGIQSKFGSLRSIASSAIHAVIGFFPGSPAKEGPLSGQGYSLLRGQRMMQDFAKGMQLATPVVASASNSAMSTVNFGPGAVNANFYGSNPTPAQAQTLGASVGAGIGNMLAARDARATIRSM